MLESRLPFDVFAIQRGLVALCGCLALVVAIVAAPSLNLPSAGGGEPQVTAAEGYGDLPLSFEPSAGRYSHDIDFVSSSAAGSVAVGSEGFRFAQSYGTKKNPKSAAIAMTLPGATLEGAQGIGQLPGVVNDLRGDDPAKHVTNIPTFERVGYESVWPGIDLALHGRSGAPEYDFRLAPGADPSVISLDIRGADSARVASNGDLVIRSGDARFRQQAPVSWQPGPSGRTSVESAFVLKGNRVSFSLGGYDRSRPLVIDPVALSYSTYLGGNNYDLANAIAVDSSGAAYVAGYTFSSDFDTAGPIEGDSANADAFVSKLNPAGSALAYSTYLGGNGYDQASAIAVDSSGAAYVAGTTESSDFNTVGAIEGDSANADAFVSKLNPVGSALAYSTYLGGNSVDLANAIAVDSSGAAYVAGSTESTDFDTVGAIEGDSADRDAFVSKLNPAGSALAYSTYLGGNSFEQANAIAVDSSGAAYVAGQTDSTDFNTVGPIEGDGASTDAFVSKLNPAGSVLAYSTYLGGNSFDQAFAIAVDSSGAAYLAGVTDSTDFNTVSAIEGYSAFGDAFVSKLNPAGSALAYSTYLGGSDFDQASGIAVDSTGAAYVAGVTYSTDFNTAGPIEGDSAGADAFVSKLNPAGSALAYSTYLGGNSYDQAIAIAVDSSGAAYVAGYADSSDFNTVGAIEGDSAGPDGFVSKIAAPDTTITSGPPEGSITGDTTPSLSFSSDNPTAGFECRIDGGPWEECESPRTVGPLGGGAHTFRVRAIDDLGNRDLAPTSRNFTVDADPPETQIDSGPTGTTNDSTPQFTFSAPGESSPAFQCRADGGAWSSCTSPHTTAALSEGLHEFEVRTTDAAGNTDESAAGRFFTIDTTAPQTVLAAVKKTIKVKKTAKVEFSFSASESGSEFECSLDDEAFAPCESPLQRTGIPKGSHTFKVQATDRAGNTDESAAEATFKVKKKK